MEVRLKRKYTAHKSSKSHHKNNHGGNSGKSAGKHTPHPAVHGFRKNGYKVEAKWNPKEKVDE